MERLTEVQAIISAWQEKIYSPEQLTPESRLARASLEWDELMHEAGNGADLRRMAEEATDVIIGLLGFIQTTGYSVDNLLDETLDTIYRKYNPHLLENIRANGKNHEEAVVEAKKRWG